MRFRRQHPIGPYFPDFICLKAKLVIEVDGTSHRVPEQIEHDIRRTKYLEQLGYEVLRVTNAAVLTDMAGVLTRIDAALAARLPPQSREAWRGDAEGVGEDQGRKPCSTGVERRNAAVDTSRQNETHRSRPYAASPRWSSPRLAARPSSARALEGSLHHAKSRIAALDRSFLATSVCSARIISFSVSPVLARGEVFQPRSTATVQKSGSISRQSRDRP